MKKNVIAMGIMAAVLASSAFADDTLVKSATDAQAPVVASTDQTDAMPVDADKKDSKVVNKDATVTTDTSTTTTSAN